MRSQDVRRIVREEMAKVELEREEQRLAEEQRATERAEAAFREYHAERNERLPELLEARRVHGVPKNPLVETYEMYFALERGIFPGDPGSIMCG